MGKHIFDRTRKIIGISLIVLFVMSMVVAVVGAAPNATAPVGKGESAQPQVSGGAPSGAPSGQNIKEESQGQRGKGNYYGYCYRCCWVWYNYKWHWICTRTR